MPAKGSSLHLVKSGPGKTVKHPIFRTDEMVPASGVYRVRHKKHRLPHEVTLFREQQFPRCAKCQNAVTFELIRAANSEPDSPRGLSAPICVHELPVLDDEQEIAG
jgi:hypothetical protein